MRTLHTYFIFITFLFAIQSNAQKCISLFNQNDLEGWYAFSPETGKQENAAALFTVQNNQIRLYGKKAGYLMSEKSFHNFILTVEYKWNTDESFVRKGNNKNSGVMYLVPSNTPDVLWPKGIQFQIKEGSTGDFVLLDNTPITVKRKLVAPGKSVVSQRFADAEKPIGEWNTIVIKCKNGKVIQKLNGKLVNKGNQTTLPEGRVLLQYEGYPIDFRKVDVKVL
ncbi:DUF1080 domain-containing protein [Flavobacterium sp. UMI-01]|uniref:3-keto-disaccharide hydrolase n=1 Tax=Flavobacterium sp. UMI-01 TaxID=1441053 RepID=UPI001C7DD5E7|nr:DUF1080 domain-containing protein [Flavobacterium sp. UMI-01]GIZ10032.1 hypothetical protein FUMI01_27580 [Flavobacterium sp. UMI-01]